MADRAADRDEQILTRIDQIAELAWTIRDDWTDPRAECREIVRLCHEVRGLLRSADA